MSFLEFIPRWKEGGGGEATAPWGLHLIFFRKIKSAWSCASMARCSIEHRDSFTVAVEQELSTIRGNN